MAVSRKDNNELMPWQSGVGAPRLRRSVVWRSLDGVDKVQHGVCKKWVCVEGGGG